MADKALAACSPFAGFALASGPGNGVLVTPREDLGLAAVLARRGEDAALAERVSARYGIALPRGPYRVAIGSVAFIGTGPGAWLAAYEPAGNEFAASLERELGALASVSDQSDGFAVVRLAGPKARDVLAKLIPIDVHARAFKPGDVAATVASHVGATIWRLDDAADGAPVFEMAVFRSLAGSFWHALASSAAQFGPG